MLLPMLAVLDAAELSVLAKMMCASFTDIVSAESGIQEKMEVSGEIMKVIDEIGRVVPKF